MPDYKITQLSSQPPRAWSFPDKKTGGDVQMETYKVKVEGEDDPIDVNRKPGKAPVVGEILTGTLEDTDFGKRFKPERRPNPAFAPKDQEAIRAQWAIGQASAIGAPHYKKENHDAWIKTTEELAVTFYAMVDRVKGTAPKVEQAKTDALAEKVKQTFSDGSPVDQVFDPGDEPVNLDDIPF